MHATSDETATDVTVDGAWKDVKKPTKADEAVTLDRNSLHVIDNRTGRYYTLPIVHNAINASEFKKITATENIDYYADQTENGIRIYDPGFSNTAVSESKITYM